MPIRNRAEPEATPRSRKDLLHLLERIEAVGAGFRSLTESIDATTSAGRG